MAEAGTALAEPRSRGTLSISQHAVEKLVRAAVLEVEGVAPVSATTGRVSGALGRDLPRADAEVAGHRARVEVEVASVWPYPAAAVAAGVRTAVVDQLRHLAAIECDGVSVSIDQVVRPTAPTRRRVR